jgi:ParB family chromosome partitioning protein
MTKKILGRGLASLISKEDFEDLLEQPPTGTVFYAKLEDIHPNINQPRKHFDQEALEELTASIKKDGVLSPILVRKQGSGKFEIIAGERRYRAAQLAGCSVVPIITKEANDTHALELAIIENVQRQDLNIVEEARAYQALKDNYFYSQNDIADKVGKSRSHVANILRLLLLPGKVIELLREGKINVGHAKILIGQDNPEQLADKIIEGNLNVRQTETLIKRGLTPTSEQVRPSAVRLGSKPKDEDILMLEALLKEKSNLRVNIDNSKKVVTIFYENLSELDNILQLLSSK